MSRPDSILDRYRIAQQNNQPQQFFLDYGADRSVNLSKVLPHRLPLSSIPYDLAPARYSVVADNQNSHGICAF
jgi:hypothetical protein